MPKYQGHPRAIFLPPQLRHTRHVLPANLFNPEASPFPFGLGIYVRELKGRCYTSKLLPLIYVSKEVAKDRAPETNELNGPGVVEGWYVIAEPDKEFEVRVTCMNKTGFTSKSINTVRGELYVDGRNTHNCLDSSHDGVLWEMISRGFLMGQQKASGNKIKQELKAFTFVKAPMTEDDEADHKNVLSGEIVLKVSTGTSSEGGSANNDWTEEIVDSGLVTEKMVAKEGKSLHAGGSIVTTEYKSNVSTSTIVNEKRWKPADLSVHIREESWLRSRRLIDDDKRPCTYTMFKDILKSDKISMRTRSGNTLASNRKRIRSDNQEGKKKAKLDFVDLSAS